MQRLLPSLLLCGLCLLAACAAPAPSGDTDDGPGFSPVADNPDGPQYGPGDTCAETYVLLYDNARTNFSLGSSNYQNEDFCGAYPYLKWLVDNEPLFTGEEPDDRNFLRLASTYEFFASKVDSTMAGDRKAYLDSALTTRQAGRAAMDAAGIEYDAYLRDLREGFFYYQYQLDYDDVATETVNEAERKQFDAFDRAFRAKPDSLEDWYIQQLFNQTASVYEDAEARAGYIRTLAGAVDDPGLQTFYTAQAEYLVRPPEPVVDNPTQAADSAVQRLLDAYTGGSLAGDDVLSLLALTTQAPERVEALGGEPEAITTALLSRREVTDRIDNPNTLLGLSFRAFRNGNSGEGNRLFDRAIAGASGGTQRANFYAARAQKGYGNVSSLINSCIQQNANNGYCQFRRAGFIGDAVGRPSSVEGRAAYWCLADIYRNVAAVSDNPQISSSARRAASQYERAGPTREQYFFSTSWRPGQTVSASLGSYGSCSTRVR